MAIIGEMKKLTIGGSTYTIPEYSLPIASASTLGGVKIGTGLTINSTTGVLSATGLDFDEADPVFTASAAYGITQTDIDEWNSKTSNTGTVTSITLTQGAGISIGSSGTAITTNGTRTIALATITKNDTTSTASPSHGGTFTAIDSITYDTYGRVTGINTKTITLPADNNTDTKVTQAYSTTNNSYPILFSATAGVSSTNSRGATTAILNNAFYANPSTGNLQVTKLNNYTPAAAMAKAVDTSISSASTSDNLPTSAAVASFVENKGYLTSADIASVLKYKGTIASVANLPTTGNTTGDVWHITADGSEYAWDGSIWQELGTAVDLSGYALKSELPTDTNTWRTIQVNDSDILGSGITTGKLNLKAGTNISLSNSSGTVTITGPDLSNYATLDDIGQLGGGTVTSITLKAGSGIALDTDNTAITTTGTRTISHSDTSSQASVSNSGRTYIQSITLDGFGHVTALSSATETVTNTDKKLQVAAVTSGTTYYPIVGTGTTAATRQYDTTGFIYKGTNGTTSAVGSAQLTLGNSTASGTANNKQGQLIMYGSNAKKATITLAAPSADISLALPTSGGTLALTSQIPTVPTSTSSSTTGITATTTATKTTLGTADSVTGVQSSTTTASKVTVGSHSTDYGVKSAGSGSYTQGTFTGGSFTQGEDSFTTNVPTKINTSKFNAGSYSHSGFSGGSGSFSATVTSHVLSFSHTHTAASYGTDSFTAPSLGTGFYTAGTAASFTQGEDEFTPATHGADSHTHTAPTLGSKVPTVSTSDVTVPIKNTSATSIPNVSVASATVSITDPGHTHTI